MAAKKSKKGGTEKPKRSIELFAGCGGLAYGIAEAGFEHDVVIEYDTEAVATLEENKSRGVRHFVDWPIQKADVRSVDFTKYAGKIDLVTGGPPCQPFSMGGKHKGPSDKRNMWPEAIRSVREINPRGFIFENVRGLLRPAFASYLDFLRLQLTWPNFSSDETNWRKRLAALREYERSGSKPKYRISILGVNAADYGAPQKRHRAIFMGVRSDIAASAVPPKPTHSREALVWSKWQTGDYWERHEISRRARPSMNEADSLILKELRENGVAPLGKPWVTVRDAIGDLPRPLANMEKQFANHRLRSGARAYAGHTGSIWDEPAKALKAGSHGVPGGENMILNKNGSVRYFTVREMSRLQGLPDSFRIDCITWKRPVLQLGNGAPVQLGRAFARALYALIK